MIDAYLYVSTPYESTMPRAILILIAHLYLSSRHPRKTCLVYSGWEIVTSATFAAHSFRTLVANLVTSLLGSLLTDILDNPFVYYGN